MNVENVKNNNVVNVTMFERISYSLQYKIKYFENCFSLRHSPSSVGHIFFNIHNLDRT